MLEQLIKNLKEAQDAINNYSDGFIYLVVLRVYGYTSIHEFLNSYTAIKLACNYNGDNGFSKIVTNNPEMLDKYPDVLIMSTQDIEEQCSNDPNFREYDVWNDQPKKSSNRR